MVGSAASASAQPPCFAGRAAHERHVSIPGWITADSNMGRDCQELKKAHTVCKAPGANWLNAEVLG